MSDIYRKIALTFWTDSKVDDDMTPEDKYFYLYLLTNPHTTLSGCYEISMKQFVRETGYNEDTIERLLKRMEHEHNVIRYSKATKEVLLLNWHKYNWSKSPKLICGVKKDAEHIKNTTFREYVLDTISISYSYGIDTSVTVTDIDNINNNINNTKPNKPIKHKHGVYGWVRLTEEEYQRLVEDLGMEELMRCITYVDESAQRTSNKNGWKDWNLVVRKCHREKWGIKQGQTAQMLNDSSDMLQRWANG